FEAFSQGDRSKDRNRGGLGLGLALVKGLVEVHGGAVAAASEGPGRGSEITIRLPREPAPAPPTVTLPTGDSGQPFRILVSEDNLDAADSMRELLNVAGHQAEMAHTGPAGLEAAWRFRPQVVLCDIGLPGMDGLAVARALRQEPELEGIYLIALTGYGQQEDQHQTRQAGFDVHLTKPVKFANLQTVLQGLAKRE